MNGQNKIESQIMLQLIVPFINIVVLLGATVVVKFGAAVVAATKNAGITSRSNMTLPHVFIASIKHKTPMMFIGRPARACNRKYYVCIYIIHTSLP